MLTRAEYSKTAHLMWLRIRFVSLPAEYNLFQRSTHWALRSAIGHIGEQHQYDDADEGDHAKHNLSGTLASSLGHQYLPSRQSSRKAQTGFMGLHTSSTPLAEKGDKEQSKEREQRVTHGC